MNSQVNSVSIMFPFLNDWGTVGSLVSLAIQTVQSYTDDWEVVIVNDGSTKENSDALEMIIERINSKYEIRLPTKARNPKQSTAQKRKKPQSTAHNTPRIRIIHHPKNTGYGGALRSGFSHCTKEWIFYTDCDAQYDPREMGALINAANTSSLPTSSLGMVNGYKIKRHDPWYRIVAGRVYHHVVKIAFGIPISDTDCDFRLIRRTVFDTVCLYESTGTICVELVTKIHHAGYAILEVPVHHFWRTSGKSQFFNISRLAKTAENLFGVWWKLRIQQRYA